MFSAIRRMLADFDVSGYEDDLAFFLEKHTVQALWLMNVQSRGKIF